MCVPPKQYQVIKYSIRKGNEGGMFALDETTGVLTTKISFPTKQFDREKIAQYTLMVDAADSGNPQPSLGSTKAVYITISDANDELPVFTPSKYSFTVKEQELSGTALLGVVDISASDKDVGKNAAINYRVHSDFKGKVPFKFADASVPKLTTTAKLTYDATPNATTTYEFKISAFNPNDATQADVSATVRVVVTDTNDNAPYFVNKRIIKRVDENMTVGSVVVTQQELAVNDLDSNPKLKVAITDGNQKFKFIIGSKGNLLLASPLELEGPNAIASFKLTLNVSDGTYASGSTVVEIEVKDVNDQGPVFDQSEYILNASESTAPSTVLLAVTASDKDTKSSSSQTFSIMQPTTSPFALDAASGKLTLVSALDRENVSRYELVIQVEDKSLTDKTIKPSKAVVRIEILDVNDNTPLFDQALGYSVSLTEEANAGTAVGVVTAADNDLGDSGQILYFWLECSTAATTTAGQATTVPTTAGAATTTAFGGERWHDASTCACVKAFALDSATGIVTTKAKIDREKTPTFLCTVIATDRGVPARKSSVAFNVSLLDINDNKPTLKPENLTAVVQRNQTTETVIARFESTDPDEGVNKEVEFQILLQSHKDLLCINKTSGVVRLCNNSNLCTTNKNVESANAVVAAIDHAKAPLYDSKVLQIRVENIKTPTLKLQETKMTLAVPHGTPKSQNLAAIKATLTGCATGTLQYALSAPSDDFVVDAVTGELTTAREIVIETSKTVKLQVAVSVTGAKSVVDITVNMMAPPGREVKFKGSNMFLLFGSTAESGGKSKHTLAQYSQRQDAQGTVSVGQGTFQTDKPFSLSKSSQPPAKLAASLLTTSIWVEDSRARIAVHISDAFGSSFVSAADVVFRLVPDSNLQQVKAGNLEAVVRGPSGSGCSDNICYLEVSLPSAFFTTRSLQTDGTLAAFVGFKGNEKSFLSVGKITAIRSPYSSASTLNDIVCTTPGSPYYPGQELTIQVSSSVKYATTAFTLILEQDNRLSVSSIVGDQSRWSITITKTSTKTIIIGVLQTSVLGKLDSTAFGMEKLFDIKMRVAADVPDTTSAKFKISTDMLAQHILGRVNIRNTERKSGQAAPISSVLDWRNKLVQVEAEVLVVKDESVGILPIVFQPALVNTAVLDGTPVASSILVVQCRKCYRVPATANVKCRSQCSRVTDATCTVSDSTVASAAKCKISLDGSEKAGSDSLKISISHEKHAASALFQVWYPKLPLLVQASRTTLAPIMNLQLDKRCLTVFTPATIAVTTQFSTSKSFDTGASKWVTVLTESMKIQLKSSDGSVAAISTTEFHPTVTALKAGTTTISVAGVGKQLNQVLGFTKLTAGTSAVGLAVVKLTISLVQNVGVAFTGSGPTVAMTHQESKYSLDVAGKSAQVVAYASLTDGSRYMIPWKELQLSVVETNQTLLSIDKTQVIAKGTVSGFVTLAASWSSSFPTCAGNTPNWTASMPVVVKMEDPINIRIQVSGARITSSTDPARQAPISLPASATVRVFLLFKNNPPLEMTHDPKLKFLLPGESLLSIEYKGKQWQITSKQVGGADKGGTTKFSVSLNHISKKLTESFSGNQQLMSVALLQTVKVIANPYPLYPNSGQKEMSTIRPYKGTSPVVYQKLVLRMLVATTDAPNTLIEAAGASSAAFVLEKPNSDVKSTGIAKIQDTGASKLLVAISDGFVDIKGQFAGSCGSSCSEVRIEVSARFPLVVKTLTTVKANPAQYLVGVKGKTNSYMDVGASFDDGTSLPVLFETRGGLREPVLPGLIAFTSANTAAATIDAKRGTLALKGSASTMVKITASAPASSTSADILIACNLDPDLGDVDLGQRFGTPLPLVLPGGDFPLEVRVNSAGNEIGSFTFLVQYDATVVEPVVEKASVVVTPGSDLVKGGGAGNLFAALIPGYVKVVGYPKNSNQIGSIYHLFTLRFKVKSTVKDQTEMKFGGKVELMVTYSNSKLTIGTQGRSFITGQISGVVGKGKIRRERDLPLASATTLPSHATPFVLYSSSAESAELQLPPAAAIMHASRQRRATCSIAGDADCDGTHDIRDAAYVSKYVGEKLLDFKGTYGKLFTGTNTPNSAQKEHMDADRNTVIDALDAMYSAKVTVDMNRFLNSFSFSPTNITAGECQLTLEAEVVMSNNKADTSKENVHRTIVYFDISSASSQLSTFPKAAVDDCEACSGEVQRAVGHRGAKNKVFGGLIRAEQTFTGPNKDFKGVYRASFQADYTAPFSVSVIIATLDTFMQSSTQRVSFVGGAAKIKSPSVYFDDTLTLKLDVTETDSVSLTLPGYSPLSPLTNRNTSTHCQNVWTNIHVPQFSQPEYKIHVLEATVANTTVLRVHATDNDKLLAAKITYNIVGDKDVLSTFAIDKYGNITLKKGLDLKAKPFYIFNVSATDGMPPFNSNITRVHITIIGSLVFVRPIQPDATFVESIGAFKACAWFG